MGCCRWWTLTKIVLAVLILFMASVVPTFAVDSEEELGNWIGATSALRYSDEWSLFLQGELRTWEMVSNLNELLWRVGGLYDFSKRYMGAFGYVRVDTWPFTDVGLRKFYENRLYEEFLIKTNGTIRKSTTGSGWNNAGLRRRNSARRTPIG